MSGHTKEPLFGQHEYPFAFNDYDEVEDATGKVVGTFDRTRDDIGLHFTSCVNALAGANNPAALPALIEAAKDIERVFGDIEMGEVDRRLALQDLRTALANLRGDTA